MAEPMDEADVEQGMRDRLYDEADPNERGSVNRLHQRFQNEPRFHAVTMRLREVIRTVQARSDASGGGVGDYIDNDELLAFAEAIDALYREPAHQEPEQSDPADAPAEDDEQVQQIVDSLGTGWPTGRYVDPHPGASNAPDGIESGTAPSFTVRFDRAGFQMSVATADGETTDLSRLADLAEAAIHIEES